MSEVGRSPHEAEARERWGDTEAYKESSKRTKGYTKADWQLIHRELEAIEAAFAEALRSGAPSDGERATDLAEEARGHIDRWYYPCSHRMHEGLAEMYTADARFKAHYEERATGLADYVASAIKANAARQGS